MNKKELLFVASLLLAGCSNPVETSTKSARKLELPSDLSAIDLSAILRQQVVLNTLGSTPSGSCGPEGSGPAARDVCRVSITVDLLAPDVCVATIAGPLHVPKTITKPRIVWALNFTPRVPPADQAKFELQEKFGILVTDQNDDLVDWTLSHGRGDDAVSTVDRKRRFHLHHKNKLGTTASPKTVTYLPIVIYNPAALKPSILCQAVDPVIYNDGS